MPTVIPAPLWLAEKSVFSPYASAIWVGLNPVVDPSPLGHEAEGDAGWAGTGEFSNWAGVLYRAFVNP